MTEKRQQRGMNDIPKEQLAEDIYGTRFDEAEHEIALHGDDLYGDKKPVHKGVVNNPPEHEHD